MHSPVTRKVISSIVMIAYMGAILYSPLVPSTAHAALVETIENTCVADPTQNGKCVLTETLEDGPSCKIIDGQEVCKDWWRQDFTYNCTGSFDTDTILAQVGTQYCEYKDECTEWIDVNSEAGDTSCRIYFDTNRPGCGDPSVYKEECIANECGDLFDRCTMKQYIDYSDIKDQANVTATPDGYVPSTSGANLGIYTFTCPPEVSHVCKTYEGKLSCPDGEQQVCNTSKVCVNEQVVSVYDYSQKSCFADRDVQLYSYPKNSAEATSLKADSKCIKTGEVSLVTPNKTFSIIGGWNETLEQKYKVGPSKNGTSPGGVPLYECLWGRCEWDAPTAAEAPPGFSVIGKGNYWYDSNPISDLYYEYSFYGLPACFYATGWMESCEKVSDELSWDSCLSTLTGELNLRYYVSAHLDMDILQFNSITAGDMGNYSGCFESDNDATDVNITVNADVQEIYEQFSCYSDGYRDCNPSSPNMQCTRLSSQNVADLQCSSFDVDVDDGSKYQCKTYSLNYECTRETQNTECAEYEETIVCNDIVYPLVGVTTQGEDFSDEFGQAMALAQATNELKHVWSGEPKQCEEGMWWLFDDQDFGSFLGSVAMQALLQYAGSYVSSYVGQYVSSFAGDAGSCAGAVFNTATSYVQDQGATISSIDYNSSGETNINYYTSGGSTDGTPMTTTLDTGPCQAALALKLANTSGLDPMIIASVISYINPIVGLIVSVILRIVMSIDDCSTCLEEECATEHGQYDDFVLISNRHCHPVGSTCTATALWGECRRSGFKYCCYDSLFVRILVEQAYGQLGYSFGDYASPQCNNLTFEDLKNLDFSQMDFGEFVQYLQTKMKNSIDQQELEDTIRNKIAVPE